MRIGVLRLSVQGTEKENQYNSQFIGLAKALGQYFESVMVYQCVYKNTGSVFSSKRLSANNNVTIVTMPVSNIGVNGIIDVAQLDSSLDALIFFSDIQIMVPSIYRWAKANGVLIFPYIGVTESHSENSFFRFCMQLPVRIDFSYYTKG